VLSNPTSTNTSTRKAEFKWSRAGRTGLGLGFRVRIRLSCQILFDIELRFNHQAPVLNAVVLFVLTLAQNILEGLPQRKESASFCA